MLLVWIFWSFTRCSSQPCKDDNGNIVSCSKENVDKHTKLDKD